MKAIKKIGGVIILAAVSAVMLCSCKALDEAKNDHGIYLDDKKEKIEFRGNQYLKINTGLEESPYSLGSGDSQISLISSWAYNAYITDRDVPVLLKEMYGDEISYLCGSEEDPVILAIYYKDDAWKDKWVYSYYCRADQVDAVMAALQKAQTDHYYLSEYGWSEEDGSYYYRVLLDEEPTSVIRKTLERNFDPETDHKTTWVGEIPDIDRMYLELWDCDKDMLLTTDTVTQIIRTTGIRRKYYIASTPDHSFDIYGAVENTEWRLVPEKDAGAIERLFSEYEDDLEEFYFDSYDYYDPADDSDSEDTGL